jgi:HSP20 family protein
MASKVPLSKNGKTDKGHLSVRDFSEHPLLSLRQQMDRLFDDFASDWRMPTLTRDLLDWEPFQMPAVKRGLIDVKFDVAETDKAVEMTAELPGLDEKDIELTMADGVLTVKGEKKAESETKVKDFYLSERRYGSFLRSMRVPDTVDEAKVKATFDKGVLKVTMPLRAEAKSKKKKISISKG